VTAPADESDPGWHRLVHDLVPDATLQAVRRLTGGRAGQVFEVQTSARTLVVKRYAAGDDTALLEWQRLQAVHPLGLPGPAPLAIDTDGRWFDVPALVMSRLPGEPDLRPADLPGWLRQVARMLAAIHDAEVREPTGVLLRPLALLDWVPPQPAPTGLLAAATDAVVSELPRISWRPRLIHGDFHPGNLLSQGHLLTGIVDWSAARLGPRWFELAYCQADVALLFGVPAADELARAYLTRAVEQPEHLAIFGLMTGLLALAEVDQRVGDYRTQGAAIDRHQARRHLDAFIAAALAAAIG
jgi:aminoglycoside phosphotransferase (APT) family kinase protein